MTSVMGLYYLNDEVEFVLPVVPQRNNEILRSIYFRLIKKYKLSKFTASLSVSSVYGQSRQPMEHFSLTRLSDNSILASSNRQTVVAAFILSGVFVKACDSFYWRTYWQQAMVRSYY
ncbi:hypothetical protein MIR68_006972 [Amoeboaphelidium protococcarum]|nr:hypothetical protein MIR68_006972 [Amoeboaphelidium protococcarum]